MRIPHQQVRGERRHDGAVQLPFADPVQDLVVAALHQPDVELDGVDRIAAMETLHLFEVRPERRLFLGRRVQRVARVVERNDPDLQLDAPELRFHRDGGQTERQRKERETNRSWKPVECGRHY